jgi:hypothetical protein
MSENKNTGVYMRYPAMIGALQQLAESAGRTKNEITEVALFAGLVALERDPGAFVGLLKDYAARFDIEKKGE